MPVRNNSPLRAYIKTLHDAGVNKETAWEVWKIALAPWATKRIFDAEWEDCENGKYDRYSFSRKIRLDLLR